MMIPSARPPAAPAANPIQPFESTADVASQSQIDGLVFARLEKLGIRPAHLCSDAVFVRRVYLDAIGTLPSEQEVKDFLQDNSPNKRSTLVDRLLDRDEFVDFWAMKWSDLLRVKAEFPVDLWPNAVQAYYHWIRASIKENKPYDQFVREMLTSSGSNFRIGPVNFYRAVQSKDPVTIARTVALTFMGSRAEKWPKERLAAMAVFFSQIGFKYTKEWKEEIVFWDFEKSDGASHAVVLPDGTRARLTGDTDPREVFADWLITPKNPWFTRSIVNRVWSWLLGRGIVEEPDDIRPDNPPSNPDLLAFLEKELVSARYDLKHIYRIILNSRTYQLSFIPRTSQPDGPANFAFYPLRRLGAEVLVDALDQITGSTEKYSSAIPEPFTFIPESHRTIALPDGSITSSVLVMFGRPPRDTGLESERNNKPTADQSLYLLNSVEIQHKLEQGSKMRDLVPWGNINSHDTVTRIYLTILSRYPTDQEFATVDAYSKSGIATGHAAMQDLVWALINSAEFLYRH